MNTELMETRKGETREKDTSVEDDTERGKSKYIQWAQNLPRGQLEWELERIQQRRNKLRKLVQIE